MITHIGIFMIYVLSFLIGYEDIVGIDINSWGWDIPSRQLLHGGQVIGELWSDLPDIPRSMYMTVDFNVKTISYKPEGLDEQVAFKSKDYYNYRGTLHYL